MTNDTKIIIDDNPRSFGPSFEDWKVNDWHTIKVKNESSLEQHLQLIWGRLRDFFVSKRA
jgi:hypothetical protein